MRKIAFWFMIAIVIFLAVVLVMAAQKNTSPKALVQSWFSSSPAHPEETEEQRAKREAIEEKLKNMSSREETGAAVAASTTGELSASDKVQTEDFLNSVIQTP